MSRFGELKASAIEWDDATHTLIVYGGESEIGGFQSATVNRRLGQMDRVQFTILKEANWDQFIKEGHIIALYQEDAVVTAEEGPGNYRNMASCLVEKVIEKVTKDGRLEVQVRGLGREKLLSRLRHWAPIGEENTYVTTLADNASAPWATTVDTGAPIGNTLIILDAVTYADAGDEIRIELDDAEGWHIATIEAVVPEETTVIFSPPMVYGASAGNDVHIRTGVLEVASVDNMSVNQKVVVELDSGTHETTITRIKEPSETDPDALVYLATGLTGAASSGNDVTIYDYSEPAADDIDQIMAPATQWQVVYDDGGYTGTEDGTAWTPAGDSIFELLNQAAEKTGEFWRTSEPSARVPLRKIEWHRTPDASGMTLRLYEQSSSVATVTEDIDQGVIHSISRVTEHQVTTRIYPIVNNASFNLGFLSDIMEARLAVEGVTAVISSDLWEPDYLQLDAGVSAHGVLSETRSYTNFELGEDPTAAELTAAADAVASQVISDLYQAQERELWEVVCHVHRPLFPGQVVSLYNQTLDPMADDDYYILEVTEDYRPNGTIMTTLLLASTPYKNYTNMEALGQRLRVLDEVVRKGGVGSNVASSRINVVPGTGGATDHGALTGLADDDHTQYWNVTRGNTAIAGHAADDDAHHDPVTAANGTIVVSPDTQEIAVQYTGTGGLASGVSGLYAKLPTNSGLVSGETGLALATPGTSGANTSNATGPNHTHALTGTTNSKTTPGELIKGDGNGDVVFRYATADKVITPLIEATDDLTIDPAGGNVVLDADLDFSGSRTIGSSAGSPLTLNPDQALNLKSVNSTIKAFDQLAADNWVSGLNGTGWGISYDGEADFRYLETEELHAYAFIADAMRVRVNGLIVAPSAAVLAADFTVPAVGFSGVITVEDAPGFNGMPVFVKDDYVLLRVIDRSGGGLDISNTWGQVTDHTENGDGTQSWTFITRSSRAVGQVVYAGLEVVDFGQSGSGRWMATATEAYGPYTDIGTWTGNPYTASNWQPWVRTGNLDGLGGYPLQFGGAFGRLPNGRRLVGSSATLEAHGLALTLYETTPDDGQLRLTAVELYCHYNTAGGSAFTTEGPDSQVSVDNVVDAGGGSTNLHTDVDDDPDSPTTSDYIYSPNSQSGEVTLGLSSFPGDLVGMRSVLVKADVRRSGFSNDHCELYAIVMDSSGEPLTDAGLLATEGGADGLHSVYLRLLPREDGTTPDLADWNGARLRLRWVYGITDGTATLRLDPDVPSIALGNALPTGMSSGGDGIWMGLDSGAYKMRIGRANGHGLRWDGTNFYLRDSAGDDVIILDSGGDSYFAGVMTIGEDGSIQQGTGTVGVDFNGVRLYQSGNVGKFGVYGASNLVINNTAGSEVGYLGGLANGGGLGNAQEIYLNAAGSGARAVSAIAEGGGGSVAGTVSRSAINSSVHQIYAGGSVIASFDGYNDEIELNELTRISESLVVGNSTDLPSSGRIQATQGIATDTGLIAGSRSGTGYMGAVTMYKRDSAPAAVSGAGVLYVFESGGAQSLRVRFANGTVKTITTDA